MVVYFIVFSAGAGYILKLMSHPPHPGEPGLEPAPDHPVRTAGITPAPGITVHRASEGDAS